MQSRREDHNRVEARGEQGYGVTCRSGRRVEMDSGWVLGQRSWVACTSLTGTFCGLGYDKFGLQAGAIKFLTDSEYGFSRPETDLHVPFAFSLYIHAPSCLFLVSLSTMTNTSSVHH